ncbi:hypothetical protein ACFTXO_24795 [Streptomyces sp. NPDC057067]|uniref:hypothetical protein n=1 Tax=Streptomyces TaxID=1883 RepID=UPI0019217201|nr:hypothetical protein [Streptomyces silvae]MBL1288790.1 hypothetical protein [Streptomyces silvae]
MDLNGADWQPTDIHGLEVRSDGRAFIAIRVHRWEALLPLSLLQGTVSPAVPASSLHDEAAAGIGTQVGRAVVRPMGHRPLRGLAAPGGRVEVLDGDEPAW